MAIELTDVLHPDGADNAGGVQQYIYYAPLADILTLPTVKNLDQALTMDELVTIATAIVMKPGKAFRKLYCTVDKNGVKSDLVGERDGKSFKVTLKFIHPTNRAEILAFQRLTANRNMVFLVPETDGNVRIVGSLEFPAKLNTGSSDTGETIETLKHAAFEFNCNSRTPAPIYTAAVPLTPAP